MCTNIFDVVLPAISLVHGATGSFMDHQRTPLYCLIFTNSLPSTHTQIAMVNAVYCNNIKQVGSDDTALVPQQILTFFLQVL